MFASAPDVTLPASLPSKWPHLNEQEVMAGIGRLKANANRIDQGALGLCGEAAFFHHVLQRDPVLFGRMARLLFTDGWGFINDLTIHPDDDLLNADYGALVAAQNIEIAQGLTRNPQEFLPPMPPQADWMILSSLCDTTNIFLDFEGGPHETLALGQYFPELYQWYYFSKLYSSIDMFFDHDITAIVNKVVKTNNNHITFGIESEMIDPNYSGGHFITLESPLVVNHTTDRVSFDYWTWGNAPVTIRNSLTIAQFLAYFQGAIVATF